MGTILIVDDSTTSRLLFKAHLPQNAGLVVHEAADLAGALSVAAEVKSDLVVLDYTMPEKSGIEVAQELIANGISPKFVLLTANTQQSVLEEAASLGFSKVLEKPITADKLAALIAEVGL
jgi:two-component system, chemotaxis family, chemotaxis protein CheY